MDNDPGFAAAVEEARLGLQEGGIPIGACLLSSDGEILGRGHNMRVQKGSATLHVGSMIQCHNRRSNLTGPRLFSRPRYQLWKTLAGFKLQLTKEQLCTPRYHRAICALGLA